MESMSLSWTERLKKIPKRKILIFIVVAEIAAALIFGNYFFGGDSKKAETGSVQGVVRVGDFTLAGLGALPSMHDVLAVDAGLARQVTELRAIPAVKLFGDPTGTDFRVFNILMRWAGADQTPRGEYGPHIDSRIVAFMKRAGVVPATIMPGSMIDMAEAKAMQTRWERAFIHFRARILLQAAGRDIYTGKASYSLNKDQVSVNGGISPDFVRAFQDELSRSLNSAAAMRSLLDFIEETKKFSSLGEQDQDMIMALSAPPPDETAPVEPAP